MRKLFLLVQLLLFFKIYSTIEDVDKISVIIYGNESEIVITESDIKRKSLDGKIRTKEEIVLENLMFIEAKEKYKISVGEDDVDKEIILLPNQYDTIRWFRLNIGLDEVNPDLDHQFDWDLVLIVHFELCMCRA